MIHSIFSRLVGLARSRRARIIEDDFPALSGLIHSYFHQDMDLEFDSEEEAVAEYARFTPEPKQQQLLCEMAVFLQTYYNDLEGEFSRRQWFHFTPGVPGQSVPEFFDMVRSILAEPESHSRYEPNT